MCRVRPKYCATIYSTECTNMSYHFAVSVNPSPPGLLIYLNMYLKIYPHGETSDDMWSLRLSNTSKFISPVGSPLGMRGLFISNLATKV